MYVRTDNLCENSDHWIVVGFVGQKRITRGKFSAGKNLYFPQFKKKKFPNNKTRVDANKQDIDLVVGPKIANLVTHQALGSIAVCFFSDF